MTYNNENQPDQNVVQQPVSAPQPPPIYQQPAPEAVQPVPVAAAPAAPIAAPQPKKVRTGEMPVFPSLGRFFGRFFSSNPGSASAVKMDFWSCLVLILLNAILGPLSVAFRLSGGKERLGIAYGWSILGFLILQAALALLVFIMKIFNPKGNKRFGSIPQVMAVTTWPVTLFSIVGTILSLFWPVGLRVSLYASMVLFFVMLNSALREEREDKRLNFWIYLLVVLAFLILIIYLFESWIAPKIGANVFFPLVA
ncbi:MAG: hypothetical protein GX907_00635 [Clostridiaceae bacterium]|nr:hypothetical protein [Clostridiaceae bacterium]